MIGLRLYIYLAIFIGFFAAAGSIYFKGHSAGVTQVTLQNLKEESRAVETASKARRDADVRNAVSNRLRLDDGYRRD